MPLISDRSPSSKVTMSDINKGIFMEQVRVTSVILDDTHPAWEKMGGWNSLGTIFYVKPDEAYGQIIEPLKFQNLDHAIPYFSNQKAYPLVGEMVIIINHLFSKNVINGML